MKTTMKFERPSIRIIPRLDVKSSSSNATSFSSQSGAGVRRHSLVKGIQLEGLRVVGDPAEHAVHYFRNGADELLYVDAVASLYGRNSISDLVEATAEQIYIPLTVGGGIRSIEDIHLLLRAGADKVAINTGAVRNPTMIFDASKVFGSQCIVISIQAKRLSVGRWEVYTDGGREHSGLDVVEWAKKVVELGAGEILLTSVDNEGTKRGFDCELVSAVAPELPIPVIACGGAGTTQDIVDAVRAGADAISLATILHYKNETIESIKAALKSNGIEVRE